MDRDEKLSGFDDQSFETKSSLRDRILSHDIIGGDEQDAMVHEIWITERRILRDCLKIPTALAFFQDFYEKTSRSGRIASSLVVRDKNLLEQEVLNDVLCERLVKMAGLCRSLGNTAGERKNTREEDALVILMDNNALTSRSWRDLHNALENVDIPRDARAMGIEERALVTVLERINEDRRMIKALQDRLVGAWQKWLFSQVSVWLSRHSHIAHVDWGDRDDIMQDATLRFMEAITGWQPAKGSFGTYIKRGINQAAFGFYDGKRTIRLPSGLPERIAGMAKLYERCVADLSGGRVDAAGFSQWLKEQKIAVPSPDDLDAFFNGARVIGSINEPIGDEDEPHQYPDVEGRTPEKQVEEDSFKVAVKGALDQLLVVSKAKNAARLRHVLILRFGIHDASLNPKGIEFTWQEIGTAGVLGKVMTLTEVKHLEATALRALRPLIPKEISGAEDASWRAPILNLDRFGQSSPCAPLSERMRQRVFNPPPSPR